ncbi:hypothetical protein GCN74_23130 [Janthinobacterium sp. FT14W]|uniref:hypothetical protein n=1 Tax=Janthinobacterium sp. FT14W TaxID=2654253 RepID=UPI001265A4AD|nr:hypothetical protein [Janthinobacterium sp. FT14W]KAB8056679.1 hypothetical protein GCN74_23130 [Janthinobacterium sp. FT14W]
MYPSTVKIERVFPIRRSNSRHGMSTQSGFATASSRHYSFTLPGWPAIEAGMEITAVLERDGDWAALRGWLNHTTGEVVAPTRGDLIFPLLVSLLMTASVSNAWSEAGPFLIFLLYVLLCGLPLGYFLRRANRVRQASAALTVLAVPAC